MTEEGTWRLELPERPLTPEEWCLLADDLRGVTAHAARVVRATITLETSDGALMTVEHDERMRQRRPSVAEDDDIE